MPNFSNSQMREFAVACGNHDPATVRKYLNLGMDPEIEIEVKTPVYSLVEAAFFALFPDKRPALIQAIITNDSEISRDLATKIAQKYSSHRDSFNALYKVISDFDGIFDGNFRETDAYKVVYEIARKEIIFLRPDQQAQAEAVLPPLENGRGR